MHPRLRLVAWVSYGLYLAAAAVALLVLLAMTWIPTSSPALWRILGTALFFLGFALLMLIGTKSVRDAVGSRG
jgi:hypothetical protein